MRFGLLVAALWCAGCGGEAALPAAPDAGTVPAVEDVCPAGAARCGSACITSSAAPVACDGCTATCSDGSLQAVTLCHADACKTLAQRVLEETNRARAAGADCGVHGSFGPASALSLHAQLTKAAQGHTDDMTENGFLGHTGSNGSTLSQRVAQAGYSLSGTVVGENVAAGYTSAERVVAGWLSSDGHCRNIMNPDFKSLGVGLGRGANGQLYWTQVFGGR